MVFLAQLPKEQLIAQLQNGVILMLLGMGTVFVFLTLLVFLTKGMSSLTKKFAPQKPAAVVSSHQAVVASAPAASEADIAAAIVAAFAKSKE